MPGCVGQNCSYFQFKPRVKRRRLKRMIWRYSGWVVLVWLAVTLLRTPATAQFNDPRNYQNVPVGVNQIELSYSYVRANASIDSAIVIGGSQDFVVEKVRSAWAAATLSKDDSSWVGRRPRPPEVRRPWCALDCS
jgi:arginine exporter protein ArgO